MSYHARCLVDTCLAIHALAPWDVFGASQAFGVSIPSCPHPFATRFVMGLDGLGIDISEAPPRVEFGLQLGIVFVVGRPIPRKWCGLMRDAGRNRPWRARDADKPAIVLPVAPADGTALPELRPANPHELRIALYTATALKKAWAAGLIRPHKSHDEPEERPIGKSIVPLLCLSGPPHDPNIEMSELRAHFHDPEEIEQSGA